ncbi:MAG: hypothetical protein ACXWQ8_10600 [Ktedonobacterales bacterium]
MADVLALALDRLQLHPLLGSFCLRIATSVMQICDGLETMQAASAKPL